MKRITMLVVLLTALTSFMTRAQSELTIGLPFLPPTYGNPHQNVSLPGTMPLLAVFDSLTHVAPDGNVEPMLATSWTMETETRWVLELRRGVTFSNGEPFNAEALVAVFDYLLSPRGRTETIGTHLNRIHVTGASVRDSHTIEVETSEPNAILPIHLGFMRIPAPGRWAELGREQFSLNPVGSGPYTVETWTESRIELVANKDSWRPPHIDRLRFIQVPDQAARVQAILAGTIDIAFNISPDDRPLIESAGGRVLAYRHPGVFYMQFLTSKESPLLDMRVRRALNYAVNRDLITEVMYDGATEPASQIAHAASFGYNPDLEPFPYDPDRARALLAEAGYPDGFKMVSLTNSSGGNDLQAQQQVASDLARVGINLEIQRATFAKYLEHMYQTGWPDPVVAFTMVTSGFDPMHGFRTRSCKWETTYYCDPGIMPLIEAAESAPTPDARSRLVGEALAYEREYPSALYLWQVPAFDAVADHVRGYSASGDYVPFHLIELEE